MQIRTVITALSAFLVLPAAFSEPARACGGCFHAPNPSAFERSVVTAHRMAFSITSTQTVLWDQIRYSGDPSEFAWVLPVRAGAHVELSHDEWFAALDASTQPVVVPPPSINQGGVGCGLAACGSASSAGGNSGSAGSVQVLGQNVVGPYETATLRSTDAAALSQWLVGHGFAIPASIQPIVDAYVREGFDFIALRLRPQCGERAMLPVRVVTPGADPTLPLRMVAAGAGSELDVLLYVIGEGRWRPKNFSEVFFDDAQLRWDQLANRSNYEELAQSLMASGNGASWLAESAGRPDLSSWYPGHPESSGLLGRGAPGSFGSLNPGLGPTYFAFCRGGSIVPGTASSISIPQPCSSSEAGNEAGAPIGDGASEAADADTLSEAADAPETPLESSTDADVESSADVSADEPDAQAIPDASEAAVSASDAGDADSNKPPRGGSLAPPDPCAGFDDMDVALAGAHSQDAWVTRLRARLPLAALVNDLLIEASPSQSTVANVHYALPTSTAGSTQSCASATRPDEAFGTSLLVVATVWGTGAIFRRRRR